MMRQWNREKREPYKEAEILWRCLSCGGLYCRPEETGATCPVCVVEQAAVLMAKDTAREKEDQSQS
jgi:rubrerythrin